MRIRKIGPFILAVVGALLVLAAAVTVQAQDPTPVPNADECTGCHEGLRGYWENSAHAMATNNPEFTAAWQEAGSPPECLSCHTTGFDAATGTYKEEGVACLTCHSPVPIGHPDNYMPTDVSSRACGVCHIDTFDDWEDSPHGQQDLNCNQCHNPHTTEIRAGHSQQLCRDCHNTEGDNFIQTSHAKEGLLCTDCHLQIETDVIMGEGHGQRRHELTVNLQTCNECHVEEMHFDGEASPVLHTIEERVSMHPAQLISYEFATTEVASEEQIEARMAAPSPWLYMLPAGFGILFGMLAAPWVGRSVNKRRDHGGE